MLTRLGSFTVRRRRGVLVVTAVLFALAAVFGSGVAKHLSFGGFQDPGAESSRAKRLVEEEFRAGSPNLVLLVTAKNGTVDSPDMAAAGQALTGELAGTAGVGQAVSYWSLGSPAPLRSADGRQALVLGRIAGSDDDVKQRIEELSPLFTRDTGLYSVAVGGQAEVTRQIGAQVQDDLARAEGVALVITVLLLIIVFGSVVAAGLPVGIGVLAIIGTFFVLRVLAELTQVSVFSQSVTTMMGLGLAIDYSLFIVSRYREEVRGGLSTPGAVVRTVETAGRTVLFSAATVAISLSALLVFSTAFLRSFAYAGISVVVVAAASAVVVLPAALAALGPRIEKWRVFSRHPKEVGEGFWHRLATTVMRRPVVIGGAVVALLLALAAPFLHVRFGQSDDRVLPASASSRQVQEEIRTNFASSEAGTLSVVASGVDDPAAHQQTIAAYATALSQVPGVARVDAITGSYARGVQVSGPNPASDRFASGAGTWFSVVPSVEPMSEAGEDLVQAVRDLPAPFEVVVGGPSAELVDGKASLFARMPIALGLIALATFVLLFLMFGSVVVPLKAIVLNLLSLTATFGAMVWIFQEGHLDDLLDFTPTGTLDITAPILMFCIAFGLSMDYEVFLLSRIKEEYDRTGDNQRSVAVGLERTGRIVTAAAALLGVVFVAMATSSVTFIKLFGIGLTMAVLMDATLIRATLVPAFMRLAGDANWWAPRWMRRFHQRWGLHETVPEPPRSEAPARELERVG